MSKEVDDKLTTKLGRRGFKRMENFQCKLQEAVAMFKGEHPTHKLEELASSLTKTMCNPQLPSTSAYSDIMLMNKKLARFKKHAHQSVGYADSALEACHALQISLGCIPQSGLGAIGRSVDHWGYFVGNTNYSDVLEQTLKSSFGTKEYIVFKRQDNRYDCVIAADSIHDLDNIVQMCTGRPDDLHLISCAVTYFLTVIKQLECFGSGMKIKGRCGPAVEEFYQEHKRLNSVIVYAYSILICELWLPIRVSITCGFQ